MVKYLRISSKIGKPFLLYDLATDPIWISLYSIWEKFSFLSVHNPIFFGHFKIPRKEEKLAVLKMT